MSARYHGFSEQLYKQFLDSASLPAPAPKTRAVVQVNLLNGTFEVGADAQTLRPPVPADFLTHQLPFAYVPTATAPRWLTFLNRVVPDEASQQVLAEYLGYVFVAPSQLKLEKVLLLHGSGANGKRILRSHNGAAGAGKREQLRAQLPDRRTSVLPCPQLRSW